MMPSLEQLIAGLPRKANETTTARWPDYDLRLIWMPEAKKWWACLAGLRFHGPRKPANQYNGPDLSTDWHDTPDAALAQLRALVEPVCQEWGLTSSKGNPDG